MKEDAAVANNRIPKAFVVMLLVALSLSFLSLVLVGPIIVLLGMLAGGAWKSSGKRRQNRKANRQD